jgi:hypothetical protein
VRWSLAAVGLVLLGAVTRLMLGGAGVGNRSAVVMAALLALSTWAAAALLRGPRVAFGAAVVLAALLNVQGLPPRNRQPYDDVQAFYRTDQVLTTMVAAPDGGRYLSLLAQPVFAGSRPSFGLAGELDGSPVAWKCDFQRGVQRLALPVPPPAARNVEVRLHLTGAPSRESDYLLVYESSAQGGFVMSLDQTVAGHATLCALA